jgi:hypothetical protein
MLFLPFSRKISLRRLILGMTTVAVVLMTLFLVIAQWIGKNVQDDRFGDTALPYWAQGIYYYGTAGLAYFDHIFEGQSLAVGLPERTMAPLFKILSLVGVGPAPPPEVLPFHDVPFPTNVGTFLQPFYEDGGLLYLIVGVLLYSFGWNLVGLLLLRSGDALAIVMWANICFMTAIGFFVPKVGSTGTWVIAIVGFLSLLMASFQTLVVSREARFA